MRTEGIIKTWNDERGFGFIAQSSGGPDVFVHIKAFDIGAIRPVVGCQVTFETEAGPDGRLKAKRVRPLRAPRGARAVQPVPRSSSGVASYLAIPLFVLGYIAMAVVWRVPAWVAALYAGMSMVAIVFYFIDKAAAEAGRWRVSESTLLLFGLLGGWPGAILAQQLLRHKSSKVSFRRIFWFTVVVNVGAFVFLASPLGRQMLRW